MHSLHSAFLEVQVPSFTVRGLSAEEIRAQMPERRRAKKRMNVGLVIGPATLGRSFEAATRCLSNNLQQLHHSFNMYFFNSIKTHISSGLYLYPVFGMQLPLISYLMFSPPYRHLRSFLFGLTAVGAAVLFSGIPAVLAARSETTAKMLQGALNGIIISGLEPRHAALGCKAGDAVAPEAARAVCLVWFSASGAGCFLVTLLLRRLALVAYQDPADASEAGAGEAATALAAMELPPRWNADNLPPFPLWESMQAVSGFVFVLTLAALTIYNWSVAVPLTLVVVPTLLLVRPLNFRRRPFRSLYFTLFFLLHAAMVFVPPETREGLLRETPPFDGSLDLVAWYHTTLRPAVPSEAAPYLPTSFVDFLEGSGGRITKILSTDVLAWLHSTARDMHCVGGMTFLTFWLVYWPFLFLVWLVFLGLPQQRVRDEKITWKEVQVAAIAITTLLGGSFLGGVVWRSYSSEGLGNLRF